MQQNKKITINQTNRALQL